MTPVEHHVDTAVSHYYVYVPSRNALRMFLYPTRIGLYRYLKGYWLNRASFDSFILMAVYSGTFTFTVNGRRSTASTGDLVLLDCHAPNVYQAQAETDSTLLWMHFDGRLAHDYFETIHDELGSVITLKRATYAISRFRMIYDTFAEERKVNEARMSLAIAEVLTECLTAGDDTAERTGTPYNQHAIEETLSYIATHLSEPLPVSQLAGMALMSEYYYIRVFKQVTGYTPHTYIVNARMHAAKYLLLTGEATLKEICTECGFYSTSAFCAAFRKRFGCTPLEFRRSGAGVSASVSL
ncbi:helix-turn-helix domain-containing protein [Bifidobacterium callitrichidarum]|uniref:AraC family transcriptional regulator n=1 Tax=Bifidobacterium callitrichidarum TaxID=2052941 RepID=A0A2U2N9Z6_9BIFI|nr:AraC family transcriptional regulator [Bifidobacterium callitrichidarum]PWG65981.1 AraC family transcriptional regulator [Bifidobacterium callitrichidarum]